MTTRRRCARGARRWITAAVAAMALVVFATAAIAADASGTFKKLTNELVEHWLSQRPHLATALGAHRFDDRLIGLSEPWISRETEWMQAFQTRLEAVDRDALPLELAIDDDVLSAAIERERLGLEVLRPFENDPRVYMSRVGDAVQALVDRDYASPCSRLESATRRLRMVPEVLRAARIQLHAPPKLRTEAAIDRLDAVLDLYRVELPRAFEDCRTPLLHGDLAEADSVATWAVADFVEFLEHSVLAEGRGEPALGADLFRKVLWAETRDRAPLDSIEARGWRELEATDARMESVAERITPGRGVSAALAELAERHPDARHVTWEMAQALGEVRGFLAARPVVALPDGEDVSVREMPSVRRGLALASMSAPGPLERRSSAAFLEVAPVHSHWSEARQQRHLAALNRYACAMLVIREALPGRYVQAHAEQRIESPVRQVFENRVAIEGWGHYCEQMMIEQGFGATDPRFELVELDRARRELGRLIAAVSYHTGRMSLDDVRRLFIERCGVDADDAEREAREVACDPMALDAALGKWRILDLRDEVRRALGERFDLRAFHQALLRQGAIPVAIARPAVLQSLGISSDGGS